MAQMRGEGIFERADANNDGSVTREEFIAARADHFTKLDRNSDGYIDSNDVPKRLAARRQQQGGGDFMVGQFDADGDGKVSKEEFVNGPTLVFDRADTEQRQRARRQGVSRGERSRQARRRDRLAQPQAAVTPHRAHATSSLLSPGDATALSAAPGWGVSSRQLCGTGTGPQQRAHHGRAVRERKAPAPCPVPGRDTPP